MIRVDGFTRRLALGMTIASLAVLGGCDDDNDVTVNDDDGNQTTTPGGAGQQARFAEISPAATDVEKRAVRATPQLSIVPLGGDEDNAPAIATYDAGYHTILRSGDAPDAASANRFGVLTADNGAAVRDTDGSVTVADSNDFSSLLRHGDQLFMVSHFESRPGAMYVTSLAQDSENGQLSATATTPIDFSQFGGLWVPCAGSVTPWGTHLGGEEYEPDGRAVDASTGAIDGYYNAMGAYITGSYDTADQALTQLNPYNYGWPTEIGVTSDDADVTADEITVAKHYAMGRKANELAYVMPDEKTVYNTDDGTNVGLYMFVADEPGDLSAGTLYAMKWQQTSAADGGAADLQWIDLGHASDADIADYVNNGTTFADLFDTAEPISMTDAPFCPSGYSAVNTNGYGLECLHVRDGMARAASRLETRRYAAIRGATTELRKEEGFTFDPDAKRFYVSISERERGMEDNSRNGVEDNRYDVGTSNDVRLASNTCGTVYSGRVGRDETIGSDFVARDIAAEVSGTEVAIREGEPMPENTCALDGIANPDNISYMPGYHTLVIGEDSGTGHQNDMVWAYNTHAKTLTRIETTPYGSESTSIYFYPDYNGFAYLMSVVQHPYGESDQDQVDDMSPQRRAYTGYIGPFPALRPYVSQTPGQLAAIDDPA
ncbi:PhoX family phosphatase [Salinisphaera sp. Q1T1-3]|uniref:PhoX family protein n=1 Tax=Salinisphaera sp. Q1T1-3 TaxID=2321229 RepID=UPI000E76B1A9|nr:alkaline phosphatase PhoX [Salinisphaera sp. Q1T1-3]RJS91526.1 DUF839 domain-containing protein [Salinisphaera sp. Q1T1-3]